MDSVRPGYQGGADNILHIQIAFRRRSRPDTDGLVCQLGMQRLSVGFRIHRNCLNPHLAACPDNADRYLAAVCNQYLSNHLCTILLP